MIKSRTILAMVLILVSFLSATAQNVINLNTQVLPPFSPYWTDYLSQNNKLIILLSNNVSNEPVEVRLQGEISGSNGITLSIPPDYIPPLPITIMPRQTIRLSGPQLSDHLNLDIFQVSGTTLSDLRTGNGLPEGNYKICLRAVEYQTGRFLSMPEPMGCAYLNIRQLEPPIILQPVCGQDLLAHELTHTVQEQNIFDTDKLTAQPEDTKTWWDAGISSEDNWEQPKTSVNSYPQNILFSWTIPAGANPANTEYVLTIAEMYPQDIDPNQAIQVANEPVLFQKVVRQNVYLYNQADPVLERGRKYAFRVTVRTRDPLNPEMNRTGNDIINPMFRNNGHSEACYFIFGTKQPPVNPYLAYDPDSISEEDIVRDNHDRFANQEINYNVQLIDDLVIIPADSNELLKIPKKMPSAANLTFKRGTIEFNPDYDLNSLVPERNHVYPADRVDSW